MDKNEKIKAGIPLTVRVRTYFFHLIIALIALVVDILVFEFLIAGATFACAEIKRVDDCPHNEIVFSGEKFGEDCFYYLKQHHLAANNANVISDIFMVMPDTEYVGNAVYFKGTLEKGTCAISKNLAYEYGVDLGDTVSVMGTDIELKVVQLITAQSCIDKESLREGVTVVAYDEELLEKQYSYVSFATEGDEYPSLISLVFIEDWKQDSISTLRAYAAIVLAAFLGTMFLSEYFLFSKRRKDYLIMALLGCYSKVLFAKILLENVLKYMLPLLLVVLGFMPQFICYGLMYAIPAIVCLGLQFILITIYSIIISWRVYK